MPCGRISELDPETQQLLGYISKTFDSLSNFSIPEQREKVKEIFSPPKESLEPIANREDRVINGKSGPIRIRLFTPKNEKPLPVIVFLHRGGWVFGSLDECEAICRHLANTTGSIVAAVEYRLSPEHKFPVPFQDCLDATRWIYENASSFFGDQKKIIIAGESAGGNMAAAVAMCFRDQYSLKLAGQLLIYPVLTSDLDKKVYDESPDKSLLTYENMQFFLNAYLNSFEDGENPYVSPIKSKNLAGLPPCFMITAEFDPLKTEGAKYAESLQHQLVSVKKKCYPGVIHGFLDLPLASSVKAEAFHDIKEWLKLILA
jgi:acetyl esterase